MKSKRKAVTESSALAREIGVNSDRFTAFSPARAGAAARRVVHRAHPSPARMVFMTASARVRDTPNHNPKTGETLTQAEPMGCRGRPGGPDPGRDAYQIFTRTSSARYMGSPGTTL